MLTGIQIFTKLKKSHFLKHKIPILKNTRKCKEIGVFTKSLKTLDFIVACISQINIEEKMKTLYDPLNSWEDHQACWRMQYRGSLG